jgi:hypothetical protein
MRSPIGESKALAMHTDSLRCFKPCYFVSDPYRRIKRGQWVAVNTVQCVPPLFDGTDHIPQKRERVRIAPF